ITRYLNTHSFTGFVEFEMKCTVDFSKFYLMDINPRPWGWFYYYLEAVKNLSDVIYSGVTPNLKLKKSWINTPRLVMSNVKGSLVNPSFSEFLHGQICYEPVINYSRAKR